jgi:hypothetical protein
MKPTYYGAHVRIEHRGSGPGGSLVVQRSNPIGGGWIDDRTFYESASYCYTEAREYASALAAELHFGESA